MRDAQSEEIPWLIPYLDRPLPVAFGGVVTTPAVCDRRSPASSLRPLAEVTARSKPVRRPPLAVFYRYRWPALRDAQNSTDRHHL